MARFTLRQATFDDYDFLFALHCTVSREYIEPLWGWHEEWQEEYFRQKFDPSQRKIIQVNGQDTGVLVVEERPDELYLSLIELSPQYQNRGIGSAILHSLMERANQTGRPLSLHVLKTNTRARALYERLGFSLSGEEEHRVKLTWYPGTPH